MADPLLKTLLEEIGHQLEVALPQMADRLLPAGKDILRSHADLLEEWVVQASTGQLTASDIEWLICSRMDLSRLQALEATGLSQVEIDLFRQSLTRTLIGLLVSRIAA